MLALAHKRIADRPDKYVDHIYGEKELGGTTVLYLSTVPFEKLGFPTYGEKPFPAFTTAALGAVPPAVMAVGAFLGAAYAFFRKRAQAVATVGGRARPRPRRIRAARGEAADPVQLGPPRCSWRSARVSFVARFALGLGGSTNLSDTYPWGLWILFDLVWIAVAAGAFAMAGVIYVFQRKDLYGLGRTAVLMGLLSYSFVMVTLLADLGLPWHSYQLALQAPEHSAMFEVSWCVGLYVTILAARVPAGAFERWGYPQALAALAAMVRRLRGVRGDAVRLPAVAQPPLRRSRRPWSSATLAWIFRARDEAPSRSCSRSRRSRCRPCTRARSARCTC